VYSFSLISISKEENDSTTGGGDQWRGEEREKREKIFLIQGIFCIAFLPGI
jgi:hypothetical protein